MKSKSLHSLSWVTLFLLSLILIPLQSVGSAPAKKGKKSSSQYNLSLRARAAIVIDSDSRLILYSKNMTETRPIASLTKLMSAMVFLETKPDFDQPVILQYEDRAENGGKSLFRAGESFHLIDLLYASLMSSDNRSEERRVGKECRSRWS